MRKRLLALLTSLCLFTAPALAAGEYPDVTGEEWFAPAVESVTEKGIMTGLWRLEGSPKVSVEVPFTDAETDWYAVPAAWAKGTGVASGYADGSFGGRDLVTREQVACFLYRYAQYKEEPLAEGALGLFCDAADISPWAEDAMRHAVGAGILQGDSQGLVAPGGYADRASLAAMLQRMLTPAAG